MSHYRKLKNNTWEVQIYLGRDPITNRQNRSTKSGFKSKKEAIKYAESLKVDIRNGLDVINNKILLKDFITNWYKDFKVNTLRINTQSNYQSAINNHIIPSLGNIQLSKLTVSKVQQFYNNLLNSGMRASSCKKILQVLSNCLRYAQKQKLIEYLPTEIEKVPSDSPEREYWSEHQFEFFLNEVRDTTIYLPTLIAGLTGLRIGEICGLRWKNVDLENGYIIVCEQAINNKINNSLLHTNNLKTNASKRKVTIPPILISKLKEFNTDTEFVIVDKNNKMCNPNNISENFRRLVKKYKNDLNTEIECTKPFSNSNYMKLPQLSIHDLRHTHATILMAKGINNKVISQRLGQTSLKVTSIYTHVTDEMQIQSSNVLQNAFSNLK